MSGEGSVTSPPSKAELREALFELQRYFSDEIAPMMVSDSVEMLMGCPAQLTVSAIKTWVGAQVGGPGEASVSDFLFHAMKKLHQILEYELIESRAVVAYLGQVGQLLLTICPEGERQLLKDNLVRLGQSEGNPLVSQVDILHRQPGAPQAAKASAPAEAEANTEKLAEQMARGVRRLGLIIERLGHGGKAGTAADTQNPELQSQALATAAVSARDGREFAQYVEQLRKLGVDSRMDQVFRSLGRSLPGWNVTLPSDGSEQPSLPDSPSARAMRRIVSMAEDPSEGLQRVTEMLNAAVEQFNEGALAQATKMFELADRALSEMQLDPEVAKGIRRRCQDSLSVDQLREAADAPEKHRTLGKLLNFFPAYSVNGLLDDLAVEERRDRRRLFLSLLEVHGLPAREAVLERLEHCIAGSTDDPFGYFQRNLVFLLRRIAPAVGSPREIEIDYFIELSGLHYPRLLTREAIGALSQLKHAKAEQALIARLEEIEAALLQDGESDDADELRVLLDRTASGLARQASSASMRALFKHAFQRQPALGNTMSRLEELGVHDLSGDEELVDHLLKALKREMPVKVLGFVMPKNRQNVLHLIRSLAHTPSPAVRVALEEIGRQYGDQDFAAEARSILASFDALALPAAKRKEPAKGLTGDIELFGLPNLLQSLSDSNVTGTLTLRDPQEQVVATITLRDGKIHACRNGRLEGEPAFYQLFQTPSPGGFVFEPEDAVPADADQPPLMDVQSGLLEALRRYDEFQQAKALVPDGAALKSTGKKPTALEGESDVAFLRNVWAKASAGAPPTACETELAADSYRVRRLYAHWLETGALQAR